MIAGLLTACEDFLNQEPQSDISKEEALDDFVSISYALNGAYNGLVLSADYYAEFMMYYPDLTGGNARVREDLSQNAGDILRRMYSFEISEIDDLYNYEEIYEVLNSVNNIINAVPSITDAAQEDKDRILGEALALRALIHFDLLRCFAQPFNYTADAGHPGIVILTETPDPDVQLPRNTVGEGYDQVISDLENAINLLPESNTRIRFTALSASALLSRVYLYAEEWSLAAAAANRVIDNSLTSLTDSANYNKMWDNDYLGDEILLKVLNNSNLNSLSDLFGTVPDEAPLITVSQDLVNLFDPQDVRSLLVGQETYDQGTYTITRKYPYQNLRANAIPVLRLAEIYLNRAEAYAELNREELALADLNAVVRRASPSAGEIMLSGEDLKERILEERRKELAFEGHLLFDLNRRKQGVVREDCNQQVFNCNLSYPNDRFIQPFPLGALSGNNNLIQNNGYQIFQINKQLNNVNYAEF